MPWSESGSWRPRLHHRGRSASLCNHRRAVADIAVLAEPNGEELWNESEAYEALTAPVEPFLLGTLTFVQRRLPNGDIIAREAEARGQMLSLDRRWFAC